MPMLDSNVASLFSDFERPGQQEERDGESNEDKETNDELMDREGMGHACGTKDASAGGESG